MGDKEYLPITGDAGFTKAAAKLAYGADSAPIVDGRVRKIFADLGGNAAYAS